MLQKEIDAGSDGHGGRGWINVARLAGRRSSSSTCSQQIGQTAHRVTSEECSGAAGGSSGPQKNLSRSEEPQPLCQIYGDLFTAECLRERHIKAEATPRHRKPASGLPFTRARFCAVNVTLDIVTRTSRPERTHCTLKS